MKNDKSQFVVPTSDVYLSFVIGHLSFVILAEKSLPASEGGLRGSPCLRGEKECRPCHARLREDQVDLAPVFLRRCALACPVGRVVELVGNLRRPVAPRVAVKQIALDGLAQPGGSPARIHFPAGVKLQRAAQREMRALLWLLRRPLLKSDDVSFLRIALRLEVLLHHGGFAVRGFQMFHNPPGSSNCFKNLGLRSEISP